MQLTKNKYIKTHPIINQAKNQLSLVKFLPHKENHISFHRLIMLKKVLRHVDNKGYNFFPELRGQTTSGKAKQLSSLVFDVRPND